MRLQVLDGARPPNAGFKFKLVAVDVDFILTPPASAAGEELA